MYGRLPFEYVVTTVERIRVHCNALWSQKKVYDPHDPHEKDKVIWIPGVLEVHSHGVCSTRHNEPPTVQLLEVYHF